MGKLEDYVSSLEGKEIDPVVIASTMLELHNEEMGAANGKIATLETTIADKDAAFTTVSDDLTRQKAKNWDLANRVPVTTDDQNDTSGNSDEKTGFDQFFKED